MSTSLLCAGILPGLNQCGSCMSYVYEFIYVKIMTHSMTRLSGQPGLHSDTTLKKKVSIYKKLEKETKHRPERRAKAYALSCSLDGDSFEPHAEAAPVGITVQAKRRTIGLSVLSVHTGKGGWPRWPFPLFSALMLWIYSSGLVPRAPCQGRGGG